MKKIIEHNEITFENIKHIDENGNEYWLARELMLALEYKRQDKFNNVKAQPQAKHILPFKQEITEKEYDSLSDEEKRFYQRHLTKKGNYSLNIAAKNAGVKNMAGFHNAGHKGLYNGETANDIAKRKKLRYREDILDNMNEDELIANLFRINQTKQKLIKDNVQGEKEKKTLEIKYI